MAPKHGASPNRVTLAVCAARLSGSRVDFDSSSDEAAARTARFHGFSTTTLLLIRQAPSAYRPMPHLRDFDVDGGARLKPRYAPELAAMLKAHPGSQQERTEETEDCRCLCSLRYLLFTNRERSSGWPGSRTRALQLQVRAGRSRCKPKPRKQGILSFELGFGSLSCRGHGL
jgi:hypothetical protein